MPGYVIPDELVAHANKTRGRLHLWEEIPGRQTALVVVDMQNYFVAPAFPGEVATARDIVPAINRLAAAVRRHGGRVIWVANTTTGTEESWSVRHEFQSPERSKIRMEAMQLDADGCKLWHELDVRPEDMRLMKKCYSAFLQGSSELPAELRRNKTAGQKSG